MSQALYRKWRPQTWDAVIGQDHVVHTLRNALNAGRIAHAYLFAGPRGTGKTTTARLLAKVVNCLESDLEQRPCGRCEHCQAVNLGRFLDLIEIDAASNNGVDDVRELRDKINFSPNQGRYKVYIIDEVHMLSTPAFNALLKTLEEPPAHAIFVLATTEVHKIPATVLSRCQRHEFRRIPVVEIVGCLKGIADQEGIVVDPDALNLLARQSTGAMRDAISLLDQLASAGEHITLDLAQNVLGTATSQAVLQVVNALIEKQASNGLDAIHAALDGGSDPRQFARQIVDYLRNLLLIRMGNADQIEATAELRAQMAQHAQAFDTPHLLQVIRSFNYAANEARGLWQPALPLEMALVETLFGASRTQTSETPPERTGTSPDRARTGPDRAGTGQAATPKKAPEAQAPGEASVEPSPPQKERDPLDHQATQTLAQAWPEILNQVRRVNPKAYGLLNSAKSRFINSNTLVLGFLSEILKMQMEKTENLEAVYPVLEKIFGHAMGIRCQVDTARRRDEIPAGVQDNGMVASALRDLGGELVDMQ